jgi:subtilisin family serine protease
LSWRDLEQRVAGQNGAGYSIDPPLRPLMDRVSLRTGITAYRERTGNFGAAAVVGVVDTGIDATHPAFLTSENHTRIAWLLDFSKAPLGLHPELEDEFGCTDPAQTPCAVLDSADIDAALSGTGRGFVPTDSVGHGTHVASLAMGNDTSSNTYVGAAPSATLVVVRVTTGADTGIADGDVITGARFVFDRAEHGLSRPSPAVVNLSIGRDFGPHDGSSLLEEALAQLVGAEHPGRAIVVAAGDSGQAYSGASRHARVTLNGGTRRVALRSLMSTQAAAGQVSIYLMARTFAAQPLKVGLAGPGGIAISKRAVGEEGASEGRAGARATIGPPPDGIIRRGPSGASAAALIVSGSWKGDDVFQIELEGAGVVDLWVQNEVIGSTLWFESDLDEGLVMIPATHPRLLAVGATVNRTDWPSMNGSVRSAHGAPGDSCAFSSAGPNLNGTTKPELSAPGAFVIGAMSKDATPAMQGSIFAFGRGACDDLWCGVVDSHYAVLSGTSMSAAVVSGAAALLLSGEPELDQERLALRLQAGVRLPSGTVDHDYRVGVGELNLDSEAAKVEGAEAASAAASFVSLAAGRLESSPGWTMDGLIALRSESGAPVDEPVESGLELSAHGAHLLGPWNVAPGLFQFGLALDPDPKQSMATTADLVVTWQANPIGSGSFSGQRVIPIERSAGSDRNSEPLGVHGGCSVAPPARGIVERMGSIWSAFAIFIFRRRSRAARNAWRRPSRKSPMRSVQDRWNLTLVCLMLAGCNFMATPNIEDAPAPRDYYRLAKPNERKCPRDVPILQANQAGGRPYQELKTISATCYPGTSAVCEQTLLERACELDADALLVIEPQALGSPPGASTLSEVSMTARALRWKPAPEPLP